MLNACPKPERRTSQSEWQDRAIAVAGKIVLLDARCAVCNRADSPAMGIHTHHIIKRKYGNTCALEENLIPLCAECHNRAHANETGFKSWLEQRSPGLYERLWALARGICREDFQDVYLGLLERYHDLLKAKLAAQ